MSQTQSVLHALLPARLLLLGALDGPSVAQVEDVHETVSSFRKEASTYLFYQQLLAHSDAFIQAFLVLFK